MPRGTTAVSVFTSGSSCATVTPTADSAPSGPSTEPDTLAEVLHAKKRYEEALELTLRAGDIYEQRAAKDPDLIQGLSLIRGKILAGQGYH